MFSAAAYSCNVTQATLSAMIIKLENELGFQIFDRSRKPITSTDLGKEVIEKAKTILAERNTIHTIGNTDPNEIHGEIIIGVIPTIANNLLSRILPALIDANPNLQVKVKEITTDEIIRALKRKEIDLGIAATPLNDPNIEEEILYYEPMMVYGSESEKKEFLLNEDLLDDKIWLLEEGHCFRDQVVTLCGLQKKSNEVENLSFEGNSFETLLSIVDSFGGHTLIPELYYLDMSKEKRKKTNSFKKPIPVREVSIVSYGPSQKSTSVNYLARFIKGEIEPLLTTKKYKNKDLRIVGLR